MYIIHVIAVTCLFQIMSVYDIVDGEGVGTVKALGADCN